MNAVSQSKLIRQLHSRKLHKSYLKITAFVVGSFGPIFFLGSIPSTSLPAEFTLDLLSWPLDQEQHFDSPSTRFLSALSGGFLFGWGMMIYCLSVWVYDKAPEFVRKSVLVGLLSWCFLDSAGSFLSGNETNVLFNLLVLLIAIGPLWLTAKY
jgi:hypothetical protein